MIASSQFCLAQSSQGMAAAENQKVRRIWFLWRHRIFFFLLEKIADPGVRALNPPPPPTPDIRNQGPGPGTAPGTRSRWSGTPGDQESPGPGPPGGHRSPGPRTPGGCRRHRVRHPGVRESPGPPPRFWQLASRGKKNNLCRQQPKVRRTLPLHHDGRGAAGTSCCHFAV